VVTILHTFSDGSHPSDRLDSLAALVDPDQIQRLDSLAARYNVMMTV
jgi:hypothetical protein